MTTNSLMLYKCNFFLTNIATTLKDRLYLLVSERTDHLAAPLIKYTYIPFVDVDVDVDVEHMSRILKWAIIITLRLSVHPKTFHIFNFFSKTAAEIPTILHGKQMTKVLCKVRSFRPDRPEVDPERNKKDPRQGCPFWKTAGMDWFF